jgi:hypothetical protein
MAEESLTVGLLRELLLDDDHDRVSLDGGRGDETFVLERRGEGWLVFFLSVAVSGTSGSTGQKTRRAATSLADSRAKASPQT